ncbi:MAG: hypothetical protein ABJA94_08765 [Rhodoglobus sp.]
MPRPAPLPTALASAPFLVGDAAALGIRRGRLRASDLSSPFYGVRTVGVHSDVRSLALAFAVRMGPDQYFSHTTAAMLLGLRMPAGFRETALHVTSVAPTRAPRASGVVGHQVGARERLIVLADGLQVSSPLATWRRLGASLTVDELIALGDGLVCRRQPLADLAELRDEAREAMGQRGARALQRAAEQARAGSDSERETALRLLVVRAGFPEPEVNGEIHNEFGALIARGDLVFREFRTVLEYDGGQHREDERQYHIDIDRLDAIVEAGWRVIRVNKNLMVRRATLLAKVDRALRQNGWTGTA